MLGDFNELICQTIQKQKKIFKRTFRKRLQHVTFHKKDKIEKETKQENVDQCFFPVSIKTKRKLLCFDHADYNKSAVNH